MTFNDRDYTFDAIIKQLLLVEVHCKDGSASEENCKCIDTKHLYILEGLAEEGQGFALTSKEQDFYRDLADLVRLIRKNMEVEGWSLHGVMRKVMQKKHPVPLRLGAKIILPKDMSVTYRAELGSPASVIVSKDKKAVINLNPLLKRCPDVHDSLLQHEMVEGACIAETWDLCHKIATRSEPEITRHIKLPAQIWKICPPVS